MNSFEYKIKIMEKFKDFFLENEDEESQPCKFEWPCKCKFEWDPVEMRSMCWECGRVIIRPIYIGGGDFDSWNTGRLYGKVRRFSQPQCSMKTTRGHQCTHPCQINQDQCLRHLNFSKKRDPFQLRDTFMCKQSLGTDA